MPVTLRIMRPRHSSTADRLHPSTRKTIGEVLMISDALAGRRRRVLAVGLGVAAALTLAACSSSGSGKSNTGSNSGSNTGSNTGSSAGASSGAKGGGLPSGDIKLGAILSLSGPYAQYGKGIQ